LSSTATTTRQLPFFTDSDTGPADAAAHGAAYLPILERQHERFYTKIKELEVTNHEIQSRAIALKTEMDALKVDNVRLYERIRFLQVR
jgi:CASP C terminal